jgi:hypothetical protein
VDSVSDPLLSENLSAPRIEPGHLDLEPGTLTSRSQKLSYNTEGGKKTLALARNQTPNILKYEYKFKEVDVVF